MRQWAAGDSAAGRGAATVAAMTVGYWEVALAVVIPAALCAAWIDCAQRRVPNWLNAALAGAGLIIQVGFHGWSGLATGLLGLLVGLGVLIVPWLMHAMGAGDVKLMAAIGVWLGPRLTLLSFAAGALLGGGLALLMILSSGRLVAACGNLQTIMTKLRRFSTAFSEFGGARTFGQSAQLLPYGVPLAAGTIGVLVTYYLGGWL